MKKLDFLPFAVELNCANLREVFASPFYALEPTPLSCGRRLLSLLAAKESLSKTGFPDIYRRFVEKTMDVLGL